ncbi:carbohydrate ABC transporter permease [Nocardiopsis oceani]
MKWSSRLRRVPAGLTMVLITLIALGPIYWVIVSAFKTPQEIIQPTPTLWPQTWTLANFSRLLETTPYTTYLTNSLLVALGTTALTVVLAVCAAYGLYRLKVPGSGKIAGLILVAFMIPGTLLIVPLYGILTDIGLINSLAGLVLVNVAFTAPFCTWLLRGFIMSVPKEIDEAAAIDGAGPVRTMFQIVLPLMAPGIATAVVYSFVFSWTEFVYATQFILDDRLQTLPIGLSAIVGQYTIDWGLVMAGTVFTILPTLILFIFAGRYFVGGLITGANKA